MKFILYIILLLPFGLTSQTNNLFEEFDTVKFENRTGGKIDSMDLANSNFISTTPGGGMDLNNGVFDSKFIFNHIGLQNFRNQPSTSAMKFTGTPHLGFSYSFGTKGSQFLHFDYQHAISLKTLLNINSSRNSSNGFTNNSKYSYGDIDFKLRRNGKLYSYLLEGNYSNRITKLNGGVVISSDINNQSLDLQTVNKYNSNSLTKIGNVKLSNYYNLLNDSLKAIGIASEHQYDITGRVYNDIDSIKNPNYDADTTRDQYRLASIKNGGGLYYKFNHVMISALIQHRYWDFQNNGNHRDTNEINIVSNLDVFKKGYSIKNNFTYNIIGAGNEWSNKSSISKSFLKLKMGGTLVFEQKWPDPFQRFYISNIYDYNLNKYNLQSRVHGELSSSYKISKTKLISASLSNTTLKNNYFFSNIDSTWRNDTLNLIQISSMKVSSELQFGIFNIHPKATFNFSTANFSHLPSTQLNARIFIKKLFFKAKKLEGVVGVDFSWTSSYKLMSYNSPLDVYTLENSNLSFNAMANMSAFVGFSLGQFRFHTRIENIGYFWNDRSNQVLIGYPIQKNYIKLGLTWDFFN